MAIKTETAPGLALRSPTTKREAGMFTLAMRNLMRRPIPMTALGVLVLLSLMVIFAPLITSYDPAKLDPPAALQAPTWEHIFGTDQFGRDQFTRILYGGRLSLQVGLISVAIGLGVGLVLGSLGGYLGGWTDEVIGRVVDVMMAFPGILLAMAIVAVLGISVTNLMIAVGVSSIPVFARLVRGGVIGVKGNDYVLAARALGGRDLHIILRHLIPNILAPVLVYATLRVATSILTSASLNFLGMGAKPPTPEWGLMLAESRSFIRTAWWLATFPGLAIMTIVIAINVLGDGLRDVFDPRLKNK
jgi:ABC-type dipeptide/oligopeptide/nickel transport system permease subunit